MIRRYRSRLAVGAFAALAVWVTFFDSHSLVRRAGYARDLDRLRAENAAMESENAATQARIERGLDDATVEEVAREQYGMRRPGETVYRVLGDDGADLWSVDPNDGAATGR